MRSRHGALVVIIAAARPATSTAAAQEPARPERAAPPVIARVELVQHSVFDSAEASAHWYERLANQLHVTTRPAVIEREVLLRPGEPYDAERAAESERNLRRLLIFRDVSVDTVRGAGSGATAGTLGRSDAADSALVLRVTARDAWSTKPYFSFSSTGTQTVLGLGVAESNLLGRGILVGFKYRNDPDRSSYAYGARAPRLVHDRVGGEFQIQKLSDGDRQRAAISAPFLTVATRWAGDIDGELFNGDVLRFVGGEPEPAEVVRRRFGIVRGYAARAVVADERRFVRVALVGQLRRDDFAVDSFVGGPPRTVTGAAGVGVEASGVRYIATRFYRGIGTTEDVDLSTTLRAGVLLAPRQWGYERDGVGALVRLNSGLHFGGGFALLSATANALYSGGATDSGRVVASLTTTLQTAPGHTVVLFAGAGRQRNPYPGEEFDLGLARGVRAFPAHAFTGDRAYLAAAEYRWTVARNVYEVLDLALAAFVEQGGAWFAGDARRRGTDAGIGLRFASPVATMTKGTTRVDLARRFAGDAGRATWVLVLGSAFPFEALGWAPGATPPPPSGLTTGP